MKNVTEILFGRCLTFDAVYTTSESLKERKIYIFSVFKWAIEISSSVEFSMKTIL